ncbi:MAG TPA: proton-conducting transporter membrane subunit [Candidatus Limnocylindrales bacterium]|nr:proton-conducting transporter membrane subunit [Candidatus Limnocylindrales bacterium]
MTLDNALTFTPEIWLLLGAIVAFLVSRLRPRAEDVTALVGLVAVALALAAWLTQLRGRLVIFDGAYQVEGFTRLVQAVVLLSAAGSLLLTLADRTWTPAPDLAGFLLLGTLAAMLAAGAAELSALILAIALLGVCVSVMVVAARPASQPAPAGVSAFIAATLATALLGYAFAFLYGLTGETGLRAAGRALTLHGVAQPALGVMLALLLAGFGILLGVVPVHLGLPALFARAPLPVCAFAGSVTMTTGLAALTRVLASTLASSSATGVLLALLAAVTMTAGNLAALGERSLRRLLAFLLVSQAGYGLAALSVMRHGGVAAALVLAGGVAVASLAAVAALIAYVHRVHSDQVADLSGMATYAPGAALVLVLALLSLGGLPPLAGFFGKLLVIQASIAGGLAWLALLAVLNAILGTVVALRITRAVFFDPPVFEVAEAPRHGALPVALGAWGIAVVAFGAVIGPLYGFALAGARAILP